MAKEAIAYPTGAQGPPGFFGFGGNTVKPFPGRAWGQIGTPKGLLGAIQTIPLAENLRKPCGGSLHKVMFFGPPFWAPKGALGLPGPRCRGLQKWIPGSEISKLRIEKPCRTHWSLPQTEPYVASYGQIRFWGGAPKLGMSPSLGATPLPKGRTQRATSKPQGQPFCPGATPLPQGQPQSHGASPKPRDDP